MERKQLIKVAETLNLNIKKNWKSEKIQKMIDEKIAAINTPLKSELAGDAPQHSVFRGYHPITGEPV